MREPGRVGVLQPSYAEHAHAWRQAGHQLEWLLPDQVAAAVDRLDVLVLVNPNNPTGQRFDSARLLNWRAQLAERDWLAGRDEGLWTLRLITVWQLGWVCQV